MTNHPNTTSSSQFQVIPPRPLADLAQAARDADDVRRSTHPGSGQGGPSPEAIALVRNMAFGEIERVSGLAASYARSAGEAAYRGDEASVLLHLQQMRLCCIAMIQTYKELEGPK